ncbi:MAG: polysaccharide deacetylase family protein [Parvibaculum sp.]|uniref:polysaccharide deacetylase family protein n=1 Tax=Parvibaculum sp. TaxID=2024848 RepID=UPI0025DE723D|nr:polysaccharide deacetylase family protein [Parvibaculum sp.]MCE9649970.1 polysaccharide deacetylase family protein [Parvibaculum sp.]
MTLKITLTFDNGPHENVTPYILDTLAERDVKASFFVIGERLREPARKALLHRVRSEGHHVGNHTWSHGTPLGWVADDAAALAEIDRVEPLLERPEADPMLFRPSAGGEAMDGRLLSPAAARHLCDGGYTCVLWNNLPRDWIDPDVWAVRALETARTQSWSVVVLHDVWMSAMRHVGAFIDEARGQGAEFTQDFPDDCLAIVKGRPAKNLSDYVR